MKQQQSRIYKTGWVGSEGKILFINYYQATWHMNIHWFLQQIRGLDGKIKRSSQNGQIVF